MRTFCVFFASPFAKRARFSYNTTIWSNRMSIKQYILLKSRLEYKQSSGDYNLSKNSISPPVILLLSKKIQDDYHFKLEVSKEANTLHNPVEPYLSFLEREEPFLGSSLSKPRAILDLVVTFSWAVLSKSIVA